MSVSHPPRAGRFGPALKPPSPVIPDAEPIFRVGDTVMHPSEGVCALSQIRRMEMGAVGQRSYYVLLPASSKSSSTVYMPVARGNEILRGLLSREDILALIHRSRDYAGLWIADSKQRKDAFSRILAEGDYAKMIRMVVEIHEQSDKRVQEGKKPCASDTAILAEAEHLLHQEFSYVLRMSPEETVQFVRDTLDQA